MADIRRRKNDDGSVGYQVRYIDKSNKSGFGYKTFAKAKQANRFKAVKDLEEASSSPTVQCMAIHDAIDMWLDICEKTGRDGREPVEQMTLVEYQRRARAMKQYPWTCQLHELLPKNIVAFRQWLLENFTRDMARRTLSSFRSVIIEMKMQGHIHFDPASDITIKTGGRYEDEDSEVEIPSDQEVRDILGAADEMGKKNGFMEIAWARYRPMIYLPVFSGLRLSEERGLPWQNLHRLKLDVKQRADKNGIIGPVKSKAARRSIELSTVITDMLFEWRDRCPETESNLVFPTSTGRAIMTNNFHTDAWLPLFREADLMVMRTARGEEKLRPKYTPHALRHYYASKLIEKKKDFKFIQSRMGHSRIETTLNIYGHLMKDREDEHRRTADELVEDLL